MLMLMSACATESSNNACPSLTNYTPEFQAKAHLEMTFIDHDAAIRIMMNDYGNLRDQVRKCKGEK